MRGLVRSFAFALAGLLVTHSAHASLSTLTRETTVFQSVDAVEVDHQLITITGARDGSTAVIERTFMVGSSTEGCHKQALLAIEKPGRYFFEVKFSNSIFEGCKLRRR